MCRHFVYIIGTFYNNCVLYCANKRKNIEWSVIWSNLSNKTTCCCGRSRQKVISSNFSGDWEVGGCTLRMKRREMEREITNKILVCGKGDGSGFCMRYRGRVRQRQGTWRWQEPWWVELDWMKRGWGFDVIQRQCWEQRDAQLNLTAPDSTLEENPQRPTTPLSSTLKKFDFYVMQVSDSQHRIETTYTLIEPCR